MGGANVYCWWNTAWTVAELICCSFVVRQAVCYVEKMKKLKNAATLEAAYVLHDKSQSTNDCFRLLLFFFWRDRHRLLGTLLNAGQSFRSNDTP